MIEVNKNYKEKVKTAIENAANILLCKADELSADVEDKRVSGISIWIDIDSECVPKLDITKTYIPL